MSAREINIVLGYNCNYRCTHCVNDSGPGHTEYDFSDQDLFRIQETFETGQFKRILFSGGEPTLYIETINKILRLPSVLNILPEVEIVTNGWFGRTSKVTENILSKLDRLDHLCMSYDVFHGSESQLDAAKNISKYCEKSNIGFRVTIAISDPKELIQINKIRNELDIPFLFQKVNSSGRAKKNNVGFKYLKFSNDVLEKKCPAFGRIVYFAQKGFGTCCSNLNYSTDPRISSRGVFSSLASLEESEIYGELVNMSFTQIADKYQIPLDNLDPSLSSECNLCEYIYTKASRGHD